MLLIRLIYLIYLGGLGFMLAASFSRFYFSEEKIKVRLIALVKDVIFAPLFPFSLFSKEGRKKLFSFINKL
jgi:hypothetical protein